MKKITLFGDSILFGIVVNDKLKYERNKEFDLREYAKSYDFDLLNLSQMGRNSQEGVQIVKDYFSDHDAPDWAIVEFGGNDANYQWQKIYASPATLTPKIPMDEYVENLKTMVHLLQEKGCKVAYMNLPPVIAKPFFDFVCPTDTSRQNALLSIKSPDVIFDNHKSYNDAVERLSREQNIPLIDIRSPFYKYGDISPYICVDGVHPSKKGYDIIKSEFGKFLEKAR